VNDWQPTTALHTLRLRSQFIRAVRDFFDAAGYLEVETPLLSHDCCVDAWIEPFYVQADRGELFLQTSPEFAMKRLLASGARAIWQLARSFRQGESSQRHNPEFAILEWYRVGDDHHAQMDEVERFIRTIAETTFVDSSDSAIEPHSLPAKFERITYDDAFRRFAGTSILDLPTPALKELASQHQLTIPASLADNTEMFDRDHWLNLLLAELIEPQLAQIGAVFLYNYPASQAALAKTNGNISERFELYLNGVELCNGYLELTDAKELKRRMIHQNKLRVRAGSRELPVKSRLLEAMEHGLPPSAGTALGLDRLIQWRLRLPSIQDVIAFPLSRA